MVQLKVNNELVSVLLFCFSGVHVTKVCIVIEILNSLTKDDPKHA